MNTSQKIMTLKVGETIIRILLHCDKCQSESVIEHEMSENSNGGYHICNCPFCGEEVDEELQCEKEENGY